MGCCNCKTTSERCFTEGGESKCRKCWNEQPIPNRKKVYEEVLTYLATLPPNRLRASPSGPDQSEYAQHCLDVETEMMRHDQKWFAIWKERFEAVDAEAAAAPVETK